MMAVIRSVIIAALLWLCCVSASAQSAPTLGEALAMLKQPGHHLLMRHALAPGISEPDKFVLEDCTTQRNLDDVGRAQSVALGKAFAQAGVTPDRLLSSPWCRCIDTAALMGIGSVEKFDLLYSVWEEPNEMAEKSARELTQWLINLDPNQTVVMVGHSINILAMTGRVLQSGHGLILKVEDGVIDVVATIAPPQAEG